MLCLVASSTFFATFSATEVAETTESIERANKKAMARNYSPCIVHVSLFVDNNHPLHIGLTLFISMDMEEAFNLDMDIYAIGAAV